MWPFKFVCISDLIIEVMDSIMNLSLWKKVVLGIVGNHCARKHLVADFGDVGLKPVGQWLGRAILDVATLETHPESPPVTALSSFRRAERQN